jgi:hypothetical protein
MMSLLVPMWPERRVSWCNIVILRIRRISIVLLFFVAEGPCLVHDSAMVIVMVVV